MKRRILLSAIFLMTVLSINAQDWSYSVYSIGTKYPGYIIKTDGTKVEGYLEAQARAEYEGVGASNQTKVEFYADPKNKATKVVYRPEDLKEYKIADKVYKSIYYSGGLSSKSLRFVLLTQEGCIAKYLWYDFEMYDGRETKYTSKVIIQKADGKPFEQSMFLMGFSKKMGELVSDYPELSAKVIAKEKGYGAISIDAIIGEYNTWCAKK